MSLVISTRYIYQHDAYEHTGPCIALVTRFLATIHVNIVWFKLSLDFFVFATKPVWKCNLMHQFAHQINTDVFCCIGMVGGPKSGRYIEFLTKRNDQNVKNKNT